MRLLVDTNIFLDILLERDELSKESISFLRNTKVNKDQIYINASSLKDIYYFAFKRFHDKDLAHEYINDIYSKVNKVISLSADDAIEAIYADGDFEDNCLVESAERTMCDAIITRNIKDFQNKNIPIITPTLYLKNR